MKNLSIIIPCYNESENINILFDKLSELIKFYNDVEIVIVDNGSIDNSITKIKNHNLYKSDLITLVEIDKNIGYGHGIMSGVKKSSAKFIAWCHGDLQTNLTDVYNAFEKNLDKLEKTKSIIKGKRINRSILDKFFTSGMSFVASFLFKCKLTDINAQPKIFSRNFLHLLNDPPRDFSLDLYLMLTAKMNNYEIIEYPLVWNKRTAGEAKGGGAFFPKIKLILRTFNYIYNLKKSKKF